MSTCRNGHETLQGANFCPVCGVAIENGDSATVAEPAAPSPTATIPAARAQPSRDQRRRPTRRSRRKRRLIYAAAGVVVVVIGLAIIGANLSKSGDSGHRATASKPTTRPTKPKPKRKPPARPVTVATAKRYGQLLRPGVAIATAAKPICGSYQTTIDAWSAKSDSLTASLPSADADAYTASDFVATHTWVTQNEQASYQRALSDISRPRLAAVTRGAAQRQDFVDAFTADALSVCHLGATNQLVSRKLAALDSRASAVAALASNVPWYPRGYYPTPTDSTVAWHWVTSPNCGLSGGGDVCWGIDVIAQNGCSNGLYAEINIVSAGTVVNFSNATLGSLGANQPASLTFDAFNVPSNAQGQLTKINCY